MGNEEFRKNCWGGINDYREEGISMANWEPYKRALYHTWHQHGSNIHQTTKNDYLCKAYKGVYFDPDFYSFKNFLEYCEKYVIDDDFRECPEKYSIDKDSLGGRWAKGSLKQVTRSESAREVRLRSNTGFTSARSRRSPVEVVYEDGSVENFRSKSAFARKYNIHLNTVINWAAGRNTGFRKLGIVSIKEV